MKDIHEVLRRKQARYAQLAKQIEMLQQAAEKLREVAPLLAEIEDDDARCWPRWMSSPRQRRRLRRLLPAVGCPCQAARGVAPRWP